MSIPIQYLHRLSNLNEIMLQAENDLESINELTKQLKYIQIELISFPDIAHKQLCSILRNNTKKGDLHRSIEEYLTWYRINVHDLLNRLERALHQLGISLYNGHEQIDDLMELGTINSIHAISCCYISPCLERNRIYVVANYIDEITKKTIDDINKRLVEKLEMSQEQFYALREKVRRIKYEKERILSAYNGVACGSVNLDQNATLIDTDNCCLSSPNFVLNSSPCIELISYGPNCLNNTKAKEETPTPTKIPSIPQCDSNAQENHTLAGAGAACGIIVGSPIGAVMGVITGLGALFGKSKKEAKDLRSNFPNVNQLKESQRDITLTKVYSAVYSPSEVNKDESVIVQIYIYKQEDEYKVAKVSAEIDEDAMRRNYAPLSSMVKEGDMIKIILQSYSKAILIEEPTYESIWSNELFKHEFIIDVPEDFNKSNFLCSATILINNVPVGDMKFKINVVDYRPRKLWAEIKNNGYRKSFISYSHADVDKIRFLAEGFKIQGIDYFFDEHSLRTGDDYPREIEDYISSCDVFILCWSENAKSSEWVKREYNLALQRYDRESGKLKFYPISIVPKADLPSSLQSKFHFGIIQ